MVEKTGEVTGVKIHESRQIIPCKTLHCGR